MSSILAEYFTEEELAPELRKSVRTLRLWRQKRTGPPWTVLGDTILYARESVRVWLKSQEQQPVRSHRSQIKTRRTEQPATA
jgi:hypothetical protein